MKTLVTFHGRKKGAIGVTYDISTVLDIDDTMTNDDVRLKLYDEYSDITKLKIHRFTEKKVEADLIWLGEMRRQ